MRLFDIFWIKQIVPIKPVLFFIESESRMASKTFRLRLNLDKMPRKLSFLLKKLTFSVERI